MATWPLDNKVVSLTERIVKPANRQTSSAGYTMSSSKGTTKKRVFKIQIMYITYAEKGTIETFFDVNQGKTFTLNSPDPNDSPNTYEVIFNQDTLEFQYTRVFPGEYTLALEVKEA